jgi:hypothetical protein
LPGVRLSQPADRCGIARSIEIRLDPGRAAATLLHRIENRGAQPLTCAPWAVTQVPLGGRILIHLAAPPAEPYGVGPDRHLVFWPYNRLNDPRLRIDDRFITFDALPGEADFKLGTHTPHGWVGCARDGHFFRKRFTPLADAAAYPDLGSSIQIYCTNTFAEIETLGPLTTLQPGHAAEHTETWEILPSGTS